MARYTGNHCPVCEQAFADSDDIVVCPDCGTPYHRACWQRVGACMHRSEHAAGFEWKPDLAPAADARTDGAVCPNCGAHNAPGAQRCSHCGVPLAQDGAAHAAEPAGQGPVYARDPDAARRAQAAREQPGPHIQAYSPDANGGIYRREVGPDDPIDGIKAKDWADFVGPSKMYYLMQFFRISETGREVCLCFSALLFGPAYLFYRKMWKEGLLATLISLLLQAPGLLYTAAEFNPDFLSGLTSQSWMPALCTACGIALWAWYVAMGLFAVSWYKKRAQARIRAVYDAYPEGPDRTSALTAAGGTSVPVAVLYLAASFVLTYLTNPGYFEYVMQAFGLS